MGAFKLSIILTVVGISLTGLAADKAPAAKSADNPSGSQNNGGNGNNGNGGNNWNNCPPKGDKPDGQGWVWIGCTWTRDENAYSKSSCQALRTAYRDHSNTASEKITDSQTSTEEKIEKVTKEANDKLNDIKDEITKLDSDYQAKQIEDTKTDQKEALTMTEQIQKKQDELDGANNKLPIANNILVSAQHSYTAVVSANSVETVRIRCMAKTKTWIKDNTIEASKATNQSSINGVWNSCVATETANSDKAISDAASQVLQAQAAINDLNTSIASAKKSLDSLVSQQDQTKATAKKATETKLSAYQQKRYDLQQKYLSLQTLANQNIAKLNQKMATLASKKASDKLDEDVDNLAEGECCVQGDGEDFADTSTDDKTKKKKCPKTSDQDTNGKDFNSQALNTALSLAAGKLAGSGSGNDNGLTSPTPIPGQQ